MMKKIFEWLREQMENVKSEAYRPSDVVWNNAVKMCLREVDEAEAKWESECCIRVIGKPFTSSCGQKYDKWLYVGESYCSKCGKPIKISEVE